MGLESGVKKLGFGLMRLPKKGRDIDIEQVREMVDLLILIRHGHMRGARKRSARHWWNGILGTVLLLLQSVLHGLTARRGKML